MICLKSSWLSILIASILVTPLGLSAAEADSVALNDERPLKADRMPIKATDENNATWQLYPKLSRACGLNSLYVMLKLLGHHVTPKSISSAVPIHENGTSLLELSTAAKQFGVNVRIKKGTMQDLLARTSEEPSFLSIRRWRNDSWCNSK